MDHMKREKMLRMNHDREKQGNYQKNNSKPCQSLCFPLSELSFDRDEFLRLQRENEELKQQNQNQQRQLQKFHTFRRNCTCGAANAR